jgi:hypothetical protein
MYILYNTPKQVQEAIKSWNYFLLPTLHKDDFYGSVYKELGEPLKGVQDQEDDTQNIVIEQTLKSSSRRENSLHIEHIFSGHYVSKIYS